MRGLIVFVSIFSLLCISCVPQKKYIQIERRIVSQEKLVNKKKIEVDALRADSIVLAEKLHKLKNE
jgi:hypothetical protein